MDHVKGLKDTIVTRVSKASRFYLRTIASIVKSTPFRAIPCNSAQLRAIREQLRDFVQCRATEFQFETLIVTLFVVEL